MRDETMEYCYSERNGTATCGGTTYYLVDGRAMRNVTYGARVINAVASTAKMLDPGYFQMTLLILPKNWKKGGEAERALENGEYDCFMREQKGWLTSPRGYNGCRCHDC